MQNGLADLSALLDSTATSCSGQWRKAPAQDLQPAAEGQALESSLRIGSTASSPAPASPQTSPLEIMKSMAHYRALAQTDNPAELFKVAGVKHEGRQQHVSQLQPGDPVMCTWQHENAYDPNAVQVQTLSGVDLGFVPKDLTHHFTHDTTFGCVDNKRGASCKIRVCPAMPQLRVAALPPALRAAADLQNCLPSDVWTRLTCEASKKTQHRCAITGMQHDSLLHMCAWAADDRTRTFQLTAVQPVLPCIAVAYTRAAWQTCLPEDQLVLCATNLWTAQQGQDYLRWLASVESSRSQHVWKLDLSWLAQQGLPEAVGTALSCAAQSMQEAWLLAAATAAPETPVTAGLR